MNFGDMTWTMTMAKCPCCKSHLAYSSDNNYNTWKCYSCGFTMFKQRSEQMMEKEKAIDLLDDLVGMVDDKDDSDYDTALKMGIQALNSLEEVYAKGYNDGFTQAEVNYENDKALSQEPCDDAISREMVIKTINNNTADERDGWLCIDNDLVHEIEKLPSVTQKSGKWIPVSERLPEDAQEVLYSTKTGRVFHGEYYDDNTDRKWFSYKDDMFSFNNVVTAWMPLPKPYEPQERSE